MRGDAAGGCAQGWAMESRIYAEDSTRSFLPSVGVLHRYVPPEETDPGAPEGVRIDSGVEEGSEISIYYDPMIAKLVTWAPDRQGTIAKMKDALVRVRPRAPRPRCGAWLEGGGIGGGGG